MRFPRTDSSLAVAGLVAALVLALHARVAAQESWDAMESRVSRTALEARLERYQRAAESPAYSVVLRSEARDQARLIEQRLTQGDFRSGDRLYVSVEEFEELTDTFHVAADQAIVLPGVGEVQLDGVLRSELQQHVSNAVAQMIREPRVRTRALVRVQVTGAVGTPGYHLVDADMPLSEMMMVSGGQTPEARIEDARVERGTEVVVGADRFQQALRAGATVDSIGLRDGDRIVVPGSRSAWLDVARDVVYVVPAAIGLVTLLF